METQKSNLLELLPVAFGLYLRSRLRLWAALK